MTMKTKATVITALLALCLSVPAQAKDVKDSKKDNITFLVSMTCEKCQKRIEDNISFEKGVTELDVDLPNKTVTIEYRKDKTSPEKLKEAIKQLGYTATLLPAKAKKSSGDK